MAEFQKITGGFGRFDPHPLEKSVFLLGGGLQDGREPITNNILSKICISPFLFVYYNMKVIIAGGRFFKNYPLLEEKCDKILKNQKNVVIVSGLAKGADLLGVRYARRRGFEVKPFPADWGKYGLGAGPIRNKEMAEYADALIVFWDGESKGTLSMIRNAAKYKLKTRVIRY